MWVLVICLGIALGFSLHHDIDVLWIQAYAGFFAALFLAGAAWFSKTPALWQRPFFTVGACGTAVLAFLLTFAWPWEHIGRQTLFSRDALHRPESAVMLVIITLLTLAIIPLLARAVRRRELAIVLYGALPIMSFAGYAIGLQQGPLLWLISNAYFIALALCLLIIGIKESRLGPVNAGMLMLVALITARFFDADFGLLAKGLVFIVAGSASLVINIIMLKQKRSK